MEWSINLGDLVKDRITGLQGIVVARTEWLNGCRRVNVQPRELKDGKPVECCSFDIEELQVLETNVLAPKPEERITNGPMPNVRRRG